MNFGAPITDIIQRRFSCRAYLQEPIGEAARTRLAEAAEALRSGPLGSELRFRLVAATPEDVTALKGLGTYGTIRSPAGFLIGAARARGKYPEDFGYVMEQLILLATDLGLGTCWLGGFFRRSSFSRRIDATRDERVPAVTAVGRFEEELGTAQRGAFGVAAGSSRRKPWEELFFDAGFVLPLTHESAGPYEVPLEMVRLGPSASNKQPWRIVREGRAWHFFVQRTPGYPGRLMSGLMRLEDLQRVDLGIAMCHFELSAREKGLAGAWTVRPQGAQPLPPEKHIEYVASWEE